jgi:hypothetical protein
MDCPARELNFGGFEEADRWVRSIAAIHDDRFRARLSWMSPYNSGPRLSEERVLATGFHFSSVAKERILSPKVWR